MKTKTKKSMAICLGIAFACSVLAFTLLCGCGSIPQPPPDPQGFPKGSSLTSWSNDFQRSSNGYIWVVNGTWTKDGKIIFQDRRFTTEQFIQMLTSQEGITTNTPISILKEPEAAMPVDEVYKFIKAGYSPRFIPLSIPKKYWKW